MRRLGGRFATPLGIELKQRDSAELFKWFLAAVLFGAPISHAVAARTYRELAAAGASRPQALLRIGWRGLVEILDRGGYVRYDEKTATKLLTVCQAVMDGYAGDLVALEQSAEDETDLERRLMALGPGVGPGTVTIFLRELRGVWAKAEPLPCAMGIHAAYDLGYVPARTNHPARILERLKEVWREAGGRASDFADFETALVRHGISLRRARHRRPSMQRTRATERRA